MTISLGNVPAGSVLPIMFNTFDSNGASITITGLAVTDIEIFKGTSMTQRSSDAGYVLLDTDGIDLDGITGIQGFSVDTGDNTDAGFYAAGSFYNVVVSAITVDTRTVNFLAATFRIVAAEGTAGTPVADATRWNNLATVALPLVPTTAGRTLDVTAGGNAGIDWANVEAPTTALNLSATNFDVDQVVASVSGAVGSVTGADGSVTGAVGSVTGAVGSVTGAVGSVTGNVGGNVTGSVGSVVGAVGSVTAAITLPTIPTNWVTADGLAADAVTEIQAGLATAAAVAALNNITAASVWAVATRTLTAGTNIVLVKGVGVTGFNDIAATDVVSSGAITTLAGVANANITQVTGIVVDGTGTTADPWGPV